MELCYKIFGLIAIVLSSQFFSSIDKDNKYFSLLIGNKYFIKNMATFKSNNYLHPLTNNTLDLPNCYTKYQLKYNNNNLYTHPSRLINKPFSMRKI